jgi:initiation factor 1A
MVYNVGGGNKSKGLARKFVMQSHASSNSKTVRVVKESGEQYAIVQKHLGNCMCMVFCSDGYRRLCIIRKKFTGRRKTDNIISSGSVVLVGLHDYSSSSSSSSSRSNNESESGKDIKRCDLLYVYSDQEKEKLRKLCDLSKLSSSLDDSGQKNANANANEPELEDIMFVTSGTGVFNKYAKDESRHKDAVIPMSLLAHASVPGSKNVISNRDWLDGMPSDDDNDNEDEDNNEDEYRDTDDNDTDDNDTDDNDTDDNEMEHEPSRKNSVAAATVAAVKKDIINIDDI